MNTATLFVVATPIGNLEDITFRAVRILSEVDVIACEDTRHTRVLLDHYSIRKPLLSYHEHNEAERSEELTARLLGGESVALVSDAGTPLVSDPGYRLLQRAIAAGVRVISVPGPSAAIAALAGSALPTDAFRFAGFLPAKPGQRRRMLEAWRAEESTLIFYEAPHRLVETLEEMQAVMGSRPVVVARELTKVHEEFLRGTAAEIAATLQARGAVKGEITILVGKAPRGGTAAEQASQETASQAVAAHMARGMSRMDAIKTVARERGVGKREVYQMLEQEGAAGSGAGE
jgi:16S rRNA (cytidine1402-2'-O)-methyltransferase